MADSGKYGRLPIPKIEENEPVFIIRAKDSLAVSAIKLYQSLAESHDAKVAARIPEVIDKFRNWKGTKKLPD